MANSTNTNTVETEKMDAKVVTNFCANLRNGTSVLQQPNDNPRYARNSISGYIPQGLGQYTIRQGQFEQAKKSTLFITLNQANNNECVVKKGSHSIGSLQIRNVYDKEDELVKQGKVKAGEVKKDKNGNEQPFQYIACYSSEDVVATKLQAVRDEEGNVKRYEKDVLSETDTYNEDTNYYNLKDPTKLEYSVKKGDPVILRRAGSIIMESVPTDKPLAPAVVNNLPAITSSNLYPLPKPKNDDFREVLKCELAEVFRGIYNGNGNGWKPTNETIDKIEKEFGKKPGVFSSIMAQADTYGRGNTEECVKMEKNINAKLAKLQAEQTKENVNVNTNHKGRK